MSRGESGVDEGRTRHRPRLTTLRSLGPWLERPAPPANVNPRPHRGWGHSRAGRALLCRRRLGRAAARPYHGWGHRRAGRVPLCRRRLGRAAARPYCGWGIPVPAGRCCVGAAIPAASQRGPTVVGGIPVPVGRCCVGAASAAPQRGPTVVGAFPCWQGAAASAPPIRPGRSAALPWLGAFPCW
jgi:hypothetical protein